MFENEFRTTKTLLLLSTFLVLFFTMACLTALSSERTIGFSVNQIVDDRGWGANLNVPYSVSEKLSVNISVNAQGSDLIRARTHFGVRWNFGQLDIGPYMDTVLKGPGVSELGGQSDIGMTMGVTKWVSSIGTLQFGFFGRSGGAFAKRNAYDDLLENGYDEADLEAIPELQVLHPAPSGLSFQNKSSVNLLILGQTQLPFGVGMKFRVMPELFTIGDAEAVDQAILSFETKGSVPGTEKVDLVLFADLGLQRFRKSKMIENEASGGLSVQVPF